MTNQEIREYAEAVIVAFERKKTIKAKQMKVRHSKQVFAIIGEYLVVAPFLISQCYNSLSYAVLQWSVVAPFLISQCYN